MKKYHDKVKAAIDKALNALGEDRVPETLAESIKTFLLPSEDMITLNEDWKTKINESFNLGKFPIQVSFD